MTSTITSPTETALAIPKRGMPVTIITGFLGSGKTTLLNYILSNRQDLKVAVLVNEFGDINIDSQLLVSMDEDMVELSNGCICCTINDGLVDAVYRVLEQGDRVDYMVIETTGVADPLPIILTFLGTELRDLTHLDSIVTVVDTETFTPEHFESEAALKQIAYADMTLLNKTDLASPEKVKELEAYINTVKVGARILHTQHGKAPLPLILDAQLTQPEAYREFLDEEATAGEEHDEHKHDEHHHHEHDRHEHHHHEHHHHHSHHLENDGFVSVSFESDRPMDVKKFESFLQEQLPKDVFRAKGILWFSDSDLRNIFQLSGPRFDLQAEEWRTPPKNQVVFIGRNLNADEIKQNLTCCLA
ncbi:MULTISPECIES: CobW family GTP-binding protein [Chroococcidiopsis]|jgi:G3E family GTPase|uniref:Cobalamin synthesis protein P47K n=1 Tax=Chroococcidiopsis thermalis (strain PCC 7203) TaxID=251229 RepID=K9U3K1_CHRTP|nr:MULTISPECIES: GTP-binding protein [Chroococcidiopsis]AFY89218.1 cobalamin synthesis protein P47K [Chroococcidiopsis thermalis PCC 7203]PSB44428.1 GTP-binding protein [Cyanosarcina cf. burmensis CCALA 770]URD48456.1 GTP-binding protein [Chroococcidiopsis sp. CCNUC1]